jgi:hypothetical protein
MQVPRELSSVLAQTIEGDYDVSNAIVMGIDPYLSYILGYSYHR